MLSINEQISHDLKRLAQLKGQTKMKQLMEKSATPDDYARRLIILGGLVADYFPDVLRFQPQSTEADNQVEFAPVAAFLAKLTADTEYVNRLVEEINQAFS